MDCLFRCEGQLHLMLTAWLRGKADVRSHIARVVPALDSCFPLYMHTAEFAWGTTLRSAEMVELSGTTTERQRFGNTIYG